MHDAGVLATSKAATYGIEAAQQQSQVEIAKMRAYIEPLGGDRQIMDSLSGSERLLCDIAAGSAAVGPKAKDATYAAMVRHRGTGLHGFAIVHDTGARLVVVDTGATLILPEQGEVLIGRVDPRIISQPDLDLGPYGGGRAGVSRRHARLVCCPGEYLLEDLQSTNGTYVNSEPITPGQPVRVHTGDAIRFGQMTLMFFEE
jgi:hypothetical protein